MVLFQASIYCSLLGSLNVYIYTFPMPFSQLFVVLRRVDHNLLVILVSYICYGMCVYCHSHAVNLCTGTDNASYIVYPIFGCTD